MNNRHLAALIAAHNCPTTPLALASLFHNIYESLAPLFGYATRADTKVFDPDSANGRLMVATCSELLKGGDLYPTLALLDKLRELGWRYTLESVEPRQHPRCEHSQETHHAAMLEHESGPAPAGTMIYACALTLPAAVAKAAGKVAEEGL